MNTQIFIRPIRKGTVSITAGGSIITGIDTDFTTFDTAQKITIRTSAGDIVRTIGTVLTATQLIVTQVFQITESDCYYTIDGYYLDVYEDFPYSLNYNIADVREPDKRNSSFSKTIKLPGTKTNNNLFDHIYEIDMYGNYNPNLRVEAIVYVDFLPVFVGNMQILRINRDYDMIEYEVAIYGNVGDLFQKIGDKLLTDLNLNIYGNSGNYAAIVSSWSTPTEVFYPLLNNGRQQFQITNPAFSSQQVAPAILASTIFENILLSAGYTIDNPTLLYNTTKLNKLYVPTLKDWRRRALVKYTIRGYYPKPSPGEANLGTLHVKIERAKDGTIEYSPALYTLSFVEVTITGSYEAELDAGDLVSLVFIPNAGNTAGDLIIRDASTFDIYLLDTDMYYNLEGNVEAYRNGDYTDITAGINTVTVRINAETSDPENRFNTSTYKYNCPSKLLQGYLPDNYKQRDFVLGIIRMFNIYLEPKKDDPTKLIMLPRDVYYAGGSVVNWTYKIDNGSTIEEIPMGELDWKEYLLTWKKDSDYYNKDYTDRNNEIYGQRLITVENDFLTNRKTVEIPFAPMPITGSTLHRLSLPACIKENVDTDTNQFNGVLRLIYYDSSQLISASGFFYLDGVQHYNYPFAGHLTGTDQAPIFDWNFAAPRELYYRNDSPELYPFESNLYTAYWKNFLTEISDRYSKLVVMLANLTSEDVRELDFRNKVFINGTYYRLNKVIDYSPIGNKLTKIELLRIDSAVQISTSIPLPIVRDNTNNVQGVLSGTPLMLTTDISGDIKSNGSNKSKVDVVGFQGRAISSEVPIDKAIYYYDETTNTYKLTKYKNVAAFSPTAFSSGFLISQYVYETVAYYANYYDTDDQTAAAINTAYAVEFKTLRIANGISVVSDTQIKFNATGIYEVVFTLQISNADNQKHKIYAWINKNGTAISDSALIKSVHESHGGNNGETTLHITMIIDIQKDDYIELMWQTNNTDIYLISYPASGGVPQIPSTSFTIKQII